LTPPTHLEIVRKVVYLWLVKNAPSVVAAIGEEGLRLAGP
jgi:hypothetical protein